ncbi:uncharacterized protein LOC133204027 [Saccostrea echinata]|uniref:uncharacterized protein LOC133204027 n=1 Tax=Saccostrea echinata TaxID=191078 RepID=UPI002A82780F|nr:uncharacterized protein LOC133204027 [Saccostrea echinata]
MDASVEKPILAKNAEAEGAKDSSDSENDDLHFSALEAVKRGLHSVKVVKNDATKLQRELEGELFEKWHEGCEVMKTTKVPQSKILPFLDHLEKSYEGITPDIRQKMEGILFSDEAWEYKIMEWKFNQGANSSARYGMMALGRSPDLKYIDCMYVLYKMDFKIAPEEIVTEKTDSWLWGLVSWTTEERECKERNLGSKSVKALQNFFRLKALEGFYKEGLIESINYVPSIEEIPDTETDNK